MENIVFTFIIYPLTQLMELAFSFGQKIFSNTGIAIFCVSFTVTLFTIPLYVVAEGWQEKERAIQKKMKPWVAHIKKTFKGDEQYMMLSSYYKICRYHPLMALRSAFGLLIQIPFFTAAYACLSKMTALQGQSFLFIKDMGKPDALFTIGSFTVNVLPIAMTLINMASGFLYTRGLSIRDKAQTYGLALVFVAILYNSPAGLVLYWTTNNIFSLIKNIFYKLKNPIKCLYAIACVLSSIFIAYLLIGKPVAAKRALLVSAAVSLVYLAPLFVRFSKWLIEIPLKEIRENSKKRFALFSLSTLGLFLLNGLLIPSLLIAASAMEFSGIDGYGNPAFFIQNTAAQAFGLFVVWPSLVYFLYKEKMQSLITFASALLFAFELANAFIFNGNYGSISTLLVFTNVSTVDSSLKLITLNFLALLAIFAIIFLFVKSKKTAWLNYAFFAAALSLFMLSLVQARIINKDYKQYVLLSKKGETDKKPSPIFHLSKSGKNVVLLYLDRAQNRFVEPIFEESPELREKYRGFTLYKNVLSFNGHTLIGAVPCFGGYEYNPENMNKKPDERLVEKQNQALLLLPKIFTEQGDGFSAVVTDSPWANYAWIPDLSIYDGLKNVKAYNTDKKYLSAWYKDHAGVFEANVTSKILKRNILWHSLFRTSPLALRPAFYNDGKYWSPDQKLSNVNGFLEGYSALDYLKDLTDFDSKSKNSYINFTNNTTHEELFLQAPEYRPATNVTNKGSSEFSDDPLYHSNAAALKRVGEWLDFLKENGCYDNTRIVIVADHGAQGFESEFKWDDKFEQIRPGRFHPLFMFKDFNSNEDFSTNYDFMTNADTPALLLAGIVENPANPFTGKTVDSAEKKNGALVCADNIYMPHHNKSDYVFTAKNWIRVKENIFESKNWTEENEPKGEE